MSNYLPALQFLVAGASTLALSYFNKRSYDTSGKQSASQKLLNFSIIEDTKKELMFAVKPLTEDLQDNLSISPKCNTAVLIKRNNNNVYEFIFVNFIANTEDTNSLIRKINKIIYRLCLFDILKDKEYIYVTIDCNEFISSLDKPHGVPHQDEPLDLFLKTENQMLPINFLRENITPKFVMLEYKLPCIGAQYDRGEEHFRCSMEPSQILCFNNLLGEHGTPGILEDHEFREEGNLRVEGIRQFERYIYSPIDQKFYNKYKNNEPGTTVIQHDVSGVSESASLIGNAGEKFLLSEYTKQDKQRIESGGNKIKTNKYKLKTNKHKFKTNKHKFKTNKFKK